MRAEYRLIRDNGETLAIGGTLPDEIGESQWGDFIVAHAEHRGVRVRLNFTRQDDVLPPLTIPSLPPKRTYSLGVRIVGHTILALWAFRWPLFFSGIALILHLLGW